MDPGRVREVKAWKWGAEPMLVPANSKIGWEVMFADVLMASVQVTENL